MQITHEIASRNNIPTRESDYALIRLPLVRGKTAERAKLVDGWVEEWAN